MVKITLLPLAAALLVTACVSTTGTLENRTQSAQSVAAGAGLHARIIPAGGFDITAYARLSAPGQPASVYIEGDGLPFIGRRQVSADPTPTDPVALRLAALDPAPNVIYLARPCHYSRGTACRNDYWTRRRFAPEIIAAMDSALTRLAADGQLAGYDLIGFSGGGTVAALLAARRPDTRSLRTVAGNLDHAAHTTLHNVTPLTGSLNPPDEAAKLRNVPQHHFTGAEDNNVPAAIYHSYARALGPTPCLHHTIVPGATHEKGWPAQWRNLLHAKTDCAQ